jgi:hypothetical protein
VAEQGGQTVSVDEMTGIQALERAAKSLPMKPGHVERREFEYIRHGTKALIAGSMSRPAKCAARSAIHAPKRISSHS